MQKTSVYYDCAMFFTLQKAKAFTKKKTKRRVGSTKKRILITDTL